LGSYLVRRFGLMLLTLFGISVIIFMLLRLTPGNIADILFDAGGFVDPADKARIEADLGLDKSIPVQYITWIGGLLTGDLGFSYQTEKPALQEIAPRIPITAKLAGLALTFSVLIGVPLGVISAVQQNSRLVTSADHQSVGLMPAFWLRLLILMFFVTYFGTSIYSMPTSFWKPGNTACRRRPSASLLGLADAIDAVLDIEVLRQVTFAPPARRARPETTINYYHALKSALLPVVTVVGIGPRFCWRVDLKRLQHPRRRPVSGRGDPLA
jgi:peptide/nickel transport system permease protein